MPTNLMPVWNDPLLLVQGSSSGDHNFDNDQNCKMPELKESVYAITHRPKDGVSDHDIHVLTEYLRKKGKYYKVITEKEGHERHIHAVVYLKEPVLKKNIVRAVLDLYKDLLPEEKMVLRQGVKVSKSIQWLDYLAKGDSTVVIAENLPEVSHLESYYPERPTTERESKKVTYYLRLERLWYEHVSPDKVPNPENCRHFLFNMMYNERLIDVIRDDKTIIQVSRHLARYINKVKESTIEHIVEADAFTKDV